MPIYKYKAKKGPQDVREDRIHAQSEAEAIDKISRMGYLPVSIEEITAEEIIAPVYHNAYRKPVSFKLPSGRIRNREITIFSRQLASLLKSGVPILDGLNIISEQTDNLKLRALLLDMHNAIKDGATFSSTLERYPKVFPSIYGAVIRAGEDSGSLHDALMRVFEYRSQQEDIVSRFRMAMAYPVLMALVGLSTVIFMLTYVMPRLMGIFANMGQKLPLPTRILISTSSYLQQGWPAIALFLAAFILIIKAQNKTRPGRLLLSMLKLHMPIYGKFALKAELACFGRTMELLIKSGTPVLKAIDISIPVLGNEIIKTKLSSSRKELEAGGSFGKSLKGSKVIPSFMSSLVIVGEESGKLHEAFAEVADYYERDTDEAIRLMVSLLEPLMILVMGLIVGFIVMAILLPVFEINVMAH
ncbi:MAG: type II secretion system F family protein [Candidatus Omnitrophota bacterium]